MKPFFSIITPTLGRESLSRCYESVDLQTFPNFEHIVQIDIPTAIAANTIPYRHLAVCGEAHRNFGNTCRHLAWERATGEYLLYLDDDNYLSGTTALADLCIALHSAEYPDWAVMPMMRHGTRFFNLPPGLCMTDTGNIIVKREIGRWPDMNDYTADGHWVEALKANHPNYTALPGLKPVVVMEKSSEGR
jgi:glycosyltransferase involved in cell wall biosynthesis